MGSATSGELVRRFGALFTLGASGSLSDSELLDRFLHDREGSAFETLVERHGPMVLSVCRRVLEHSHDAEDAFQATFLVLAKQAGRIAKTELLGNWLYGVAYRTAVEAKRRQARLKARERRASDMSKPHMHEENADLSELRRCLDYELNRLSETYRSVIVLCDLEGLSRKQAAEKLQLSEGTVSSRLARGRGLLRERLARRGLASTAVVISTAVARDVSSAVVTPVLLESTVRAAIHVVAGKSLAAGAVSASVVALSRGVLESMFLNKLKLAAVAIVAGTTISTGATVYVRAQQASTGEAAAPTASVPATATLAPVAAEPSATVGSSSSSGFATSAAAANDDEDRLSKLERKLDRLIEVLEARNSDHGDARPGASMPAGSIIAARTAYASGSDLLPAPRDDDAATPVVTTTPAPGSLTSSADLAPPESVQPPAAIPAPTAPAPENFQHQAAPATRLAPPSADVAVPIPPAPPASAGVPTAPGPDAPPSVSVAPPAGAPLPTVPGMPPGVRRPVMHRATDSLQGRIERAEASVGKIEQQLEQLNKRISRLESITTGTSAADVRSRPVPLRP